MLNKNELRDRRHLRIRKRLAGTAERPRLCVFRSSLHIYAQVIDDDKGVTLVSASTVAKDVKASVGEATKSGAAQKVGEAIAKACLAKGIKQVVFDRGGYVYHGRITALAEAARKAGLEF